MSKNNIKKNKSTLFQARSAWEVRISDKAYKATPEELISTIKKIKASLETEGPALRHSKTLAEYKFKCDRLFTTRFHNEINHESICYVFNWVFDKKNKVIELFNVGSHSNFDFRNKR